MVLLFRSISIPIRPLLTMRLSNSSTSHIGRIRLVLRHGAQSARPFSWAVLGPSARSQTEPDDLTIRRQPFRAPHQTHRPFGQQRQALSRFPPLRHSSIEQEPEIVTSKATYYPPTTGILARLPASWVPYAELIRLDKPAGTYYLYFPCLFSTLMAAPLADPVASPLQVIGTATLFFAGAVIMRGAGCTINDLWDRNLDPQVERTRLRPIARRAITPPKAIVFTGFQLLAGLGVLVSFPKQCLYYGVPSLLLVGTYPLAKRVTNYPQFVLGLAFSWGAIMGFPALGIDLLADSNALKTAVLLYSSCIAWTLSYDMIYAFMDIKDDVKAGIKSIARAHEHNTKAVLCGLATVQVALLAVAGVASGAGPMFFVGGCGSAAASLGLMIWRVRLTDVSNCWWWFKNGCLLTGGGLSLGLLGDYLLRRAHAEENGRRNDRPPG